jgi:hypothetical protein
MSGGRGEEPHAGFGHCAPEEARVLLAAEARTPALARRGSVTAPERTRVASAMLPHPCPWRSAALGGP